MFPLEAANAASSAGGKSSQDTSDHVAPPSRVMITLKHSPSGSPMAMPSRLSQKCMLSKKARESVLVYTTLQEASVCILR